MKAFPNFIDFDVLVDKKRHNDYKKNASEIRIILQRKLNTMSSKNRRRTQQQASRQVKLKQHSCAHNVQALVSILVTSGPLVGILVAY